MNDSQGRPCKYVIIPLEVWENKDVPWTAKLIFMEIDSFTSNNMECFVSNKHLATMFQISETMVSKHIAGLIRMKWIENYNFDGRKRYLRSLLKTGFSPGSDLNFSSRQLQTDSGQPQTIVQGTLEPEFIHNKQINQTNNNLLINEQKTNGPQIPEEWDTQEFMDEWNKFAVYLYEKTKKRMPQTTMNELVSQLVIVSNGNLEAAKKIISRTIIKRYTEFYELPKDQKQEKPKAEFNDDYYKSGKR